MTEVVYEWSGEPALRLERSPVEVAGRSWVQHRLIAQGGMDGVVVIVTHGPEVLLARQYRPVVDATLWELPRGFGAAHDVAEDGAVTAVVTAAREVTEEVGLELEDAHPIGRVWTDPGLLAGGVSVVVGCVRRTVPAAPGDGEVDGVRWVSSTALRSLVADGEIRDALTLAALALWWAQPAD